MRSQSLDSNQTKIKNEKLQTRFYERDNEKVQNHEGIQHFNRRKIQYFIPLLKVTPLAALTIGCINCHLS